MQRRRQPFCPVKLSASFPPARILGSAGARAPMVKRPCAKAAGNCEDIGRMSPRPNKIDAGTPPKGEYKLFYFNILWI